MTTELTDEEIKTDHQNDEELVPDQVLFELSRAHAFFKWLKPQSVSDLNAIIHAGRLIFRQKNDIEKLQVRVAELEPADIPIPNYNSEAMGCGLEDRGITCRYDAMRYGWEEAIKRFYEALEYERLYKAPQPRIPPEAIEEIRATKDKIPFSLSNQDFHAGINSALEILRKYNQ